MSMLQHNAEVWADLVVRLLKATGNHPPYQRMELLASFDNAAQMFAALKAQSEPLADKTLLDEVLGFVLNLPGALSKEDGFAMAEKQTNHLIPTILESPNAQKLLATE